MKNVKRKKLPTVLVAIGSILVIGSAALLIGTQLAGSRAGERAQAFADKIQSLMPETSQGVWEERTDTEMPVAEVDGENFIGLIEVPVYNVRLPVCSGWDKTKVSSYPCRYMGSVYDGTLIIGGNDHQAQLAFADQIDIGVPVYVTDMEGKVYMYSVSMVERAQDASTDVLVSENADLTIFVRDTYALDYIIVRCKAER